MQEAVLPQPETSIRLKNDPDFAPGLLASEENALRGYAGEAAVPISAANRAMRGTHPAAVVDTRLRLWGNLALAIWTGSLVAAAIVRQVRRKRR